jgi:RNA polymerase sigma-70 factor (ECF subfamily)
MDGHPNAAALPLLRQDAPEERLATLFDTHHERLYRLARRMAPSIDDALDLVQETFLRAARAPSAVPNGHSREEAWLVRVLVNLQRDAWRKSTVRQRHASSLREVAADIANPEATLVARQLVWRALDWLPPRRRAVVIMHELEALSVPEIAALLGISGITVRWHLSLGRRTLTRLLLHPSGGRP